MMSTLRTYAWLVGLAAIAAVVWWVAGMRLQNERMAARVERLEGDLSRERAERQADVAGLTVLAARRALNATADAADQKALADAIDEANPAPASPGLAALFARLRAEDGRRASDAPKRPR